MSTGVREPGIVRSAVSKIQKSKPPPPPQSAKPKNQGQYERLISSPTEQNQPFQYPRENNGDSVEYVTYAGETENIYDAGKTT